MDKKLKRKLNKSPYKENIKKIIKKVEARMNISDKEKESLIKFYLIAFKLSESVYLQLEQKEIYKLIEKLAKEGKKIDHILMAIDAFAL